MIDIFILNNKIKNVKNKKVYKRIFKLILDDDIKYTKNNNGVFFNLSELNESTLLQIEKILTSVHPTTHTITT